MKVIDLDVELTKLNTPALANALYKLNNYQALNFEIIVLQKILSLLQDLYPDEPIKENNLDKAVILMTLTKFCQYAENLAAYAIAFLTTYRNQSSHEKEWY